MLHFLPFPFSSFVLVLFACLSNTRAGWIGSIGHSALEILQLLDATECNGSSKKSNSFVRSFVGSQVAGETLAVGDRIDQFSQ